MPLFQNAHSPIWKTNQNGKVKNNKGFKPVSVHQDPLVFLRQNPSGAGNWASWLMALVIWYLLESSTQRKWQTPSNGYPRWSVSHLRQDCHIDHMVRMEEAQWMTSWRRILDLYKERP
jgi:hypothetical protein